MLCVVPHKEMVAGYMVGNTAGKMDQYLSSLVYCTGPLRSPFEQRFNVTPVCLFQHSLICMAQRALNVVAWLHESA